MIQKNKKRLTHGMHKLKSGVGRRELIMGYILMMGETLSLRLLDIGLMILLMDSWDGGMMTTV